MNANSCSANNFLFGTDPNNGLANVMPRDIVTHTVDGSNGNPASGVANFLFTLPGGDDGSYEIRSSVWDASFLFGTARPQDWVLLVNSAQVASGFLSGIVSRSQAETFDVFANLAVGDMVDLELFEDPSSPFGFFVGANMHITEVSSPPTPTCPLSQGYWKNHGSQWPVTSLTLGDASTRSRSCLRYSGCGHWETRASFSLTSPFLQNSILPTVPIRLLSARRWQRAISSWQQWGRCQQA
jgi:hypothetical protein